MATSKQSTFGDVSVNTYKGERRCDSHNGFDENGNPKRCPNTAKYAVLNKGTKIAEYYCGMHTRDTWKDMANEV